MQSLPEDKRISLMFWWIIHYLQGEINLCESFHGIYVIKSQVLVKYWMTKKTENNMDTPVATLSVLVKSCTFQNQKWQILLTGR